MRPKKKDEDLKAAILQVRASATEADQYKLQAAVRKMATSSYLRYLLGEDAERLVAEGKLRQGQDGAWEAFIMGEWRRPDQVK